MAPKVQAALRAMPVCPNRKCNIAPGIRIWNCAGPGATPTQTGPRSSRRVHSARACAQIPNPPAKAGPEGSEDAKTRTH
eukprot:4065492-Alexandrium_andersonii.AAC.1